MMERDRRSHVLLLFTELKRNGDLRQKWYKNIIFFEKKCKKGCCYHYHYHLP